MKATTDHPALRVGKDGLICVENIKVESRETLVTFRVVGVPVSTTTEDVVGVVKDIFQDTKARVEWNGNKPEYVFTRKINGSVVSWFGLCLATQRKFMLILDHFEEIAQNETAEGC